MNKLTKNEVLVKLKELDKGWYVVEESIVQEFNFKNFIEAFSFMTSIAFEAENKNHHPLWENVYNNVKISLSTHDSGGLTEKDFALAKKIDVIYKRFK